MKGEFTPIRLEDYVDSHVRAHPGEERTDLTRRLKLAMDVVAVSVESTAALVAYQESLGKEDGDRIEF